MKTSQLIRFPRQLSSLLLTVIVMICAIAGQLALVDRYAGASLPGQAPLGGLIETLLSPS